MGGPLMKEGGPPLLALATTVGHEFGLVLGAQQSVRSHISTAATTDSGDP